MRIDDRQMTESQAAQAGKAAQAQSAARQQEAKAAGQSSGASSDQVELSGLLEGLAKALASAGTEQSAKVERLAAEYQSGQYTVDSGAVSRSILAEALDSGAAA
jgi:flagellar biosynthesis anti-sigma factor FlgM